VVGGKIRDQFKHPSGVVAMPSVEEPAAMGRERIDVMAR